MTAVEVREEAVAPARVPAPVWKRALVFGSALGIEIRDGHLEAAIARVRPSGAALVGAIEIPTDRPASEWGDEIRRFLKRHREPQLSATVLLPRREVIVRQIALPGVAAKDLASAIALQLDTLHPFGDEPVGFGWTKLDSGGVLIGIARESAIAKFSALFAEAGIPVAAFSFSSAAIHAALRLYGSPQPGFIAYAESADGTAEIYGESEAKPVFSAQFDIALARALSLAKSELRIPGDRPALPLRDILPQPAAATELAGEEVSVGVLPWAAALTGACPWLAPAANMLPAEKRTVRSRARYLPTIFLLAMLAACVIAIFTYSAYRDRKLLEAVNAEIVRLQPYSLRAAALDKRMERERARIHLLDDFRKQTKADLDILNELTRLLPPPIWTNSIEILPDAVTISGEAEQAAPLLQILDASPLFEDSEFSTSVMRAGSNELFRIKTRREARP